ncbi:MAG: leucyl aminopeptidase [Spirochaetota bacterium]|nr:leucyl aminopeptidase [Spirochaetota bacterium]
MEFEASKETLDSVKAELIIMNYFKEDIKDNQLNHFILRKLDNRYDGLIQLSMERNEMTGELGNVVFIARKENSLLLIGAGEQSEFGVEEIKYFGALGIRESKKRGFRKPTYYTRGFDDNASKISSLVEGIYVGDYSFDLFKSVDESKPKIIISTVKILWENADVDVTERIINKSKIIGESINFARDLVNRPGNQCTPTILANEAKQFAKSTSLKVTIFDKTEIEKMNMGSFLSVARGSDEPPKLIVMHHNPKDKISKEKIAFVGKGLTFDSGGISIKPSENMHLMKGDMSGGASVIASIVAVSRLNLPIEVIGIVPSTENMPSGKANKPGDIVQAANGKFIEILNTDAEGRLILADALCYAVKEKATKIIDIATLTGACVVALGEITTGLMGNNQDLANQYMKACNDAGEKIWQLPLFKKYHELIKSDTGDITNTGGRYGGAITAAAFLENFVDKTPWIHLDIAGTNWSSKDNYYSKGGTGVMVSSFVRFIQSLVS